MGDRSRGLYRKFEVRRVDGSDEPGGKHHGCSYFVLDIDHDPHALAALLAYADSAEADGYERLAANMRAALKTVITEFDLATAIRECAADVPEGDRAGGVALHHMLGQLMERAGIDDEEQRAIMARLRG